MQQFSGANNLVITGGQFQQVQGDYHAGGKDAGLHILRQYIAADAMYDSADRFPAPKCHPQTREKVIKEILDWINDPDPPTPALWLYGPAGAGKTAITQTIALLLQEVTEDSKYGASYFFAKDEIGRGEGSKLFSTIAYQLALNFPSLRLLVDAAVVHNPTLPTKSIDIQLRYLIIEPLKRVTDWPIHRPTVIIDGLDECAGSRRMQSEILILISQAITHHNIPLRFLIASRPEFWIADSFETGALVNIAKSVSVMEDQDANRDIRNYLRDRFDKIYNENDSIMSSTPHPWPTDYIIDRLVREASGQYIYASTVLKFVGDSSDFCDPREQLRILNSSGPRTHAFTDLDRLYTTILSAYPRPESLKRVLGGLCLFVTKKTIQEVLG